jgi:hypothetical protein
VVEENYAVKVALKQKLYDMKMPGNERERQALMSKIV